MFNDDEDSNKSDIRNYLEETRIKLKEDYNRLTFELSKRDALAEYKDKDYQKMLSKQRLLVNDLDMLTDRINKIKEMEEDPMFHEELEKMWKMISNEDTNKSLTTTIKQIPANTADKPVAEKKTEESVMVDDMLKELGLE